MPEKKKKTAPGIKKNRKQDFFQLTTFHRTAVLVLLALVVIAAGAGVYLRSEINRKTAQDIDSARAFYEAGEYAKALAAIESALERSPRVYSEAGVKYIMAASMMEESGDAMALDMLKEIASGEPDDEYYPASLYRLAAADRAGGIPEKAAERLETIVKNYPRNRVAPLALFELAEIHMGLRRWNEAISSYERIIDEFPSAGVSSAARDELGRINTYLIHSPMITEHDIAYTVRPGDTLEGIARRHNTTIELIMKANDLSSAVIPVGKRLKVTPSNFKIFVDADENVLTLKLNGRFFKNYTVGTGEYGKTPIGEFRITNKMPYPVWYAEDGVYPYGHPRNILGTRWMGIDRRGYGIHGTTEPESIGKHETAGCIRMLNEHVEELYDLVIPGVPVTITGTSLPDAW